MKFQQTMSLFLGALAVCFGTLALTRSSDAQAISNTRPGVNPLTQQMAKQQSATSTRPAPEEIALMVVDEKYVWATQGGTIYRIDRETLAVMPVPVQEAAATASAPIKTDLITRPKSGISVTRGGGG